MLSIRRMTSMVLENLPPNKNINIHQEIIDTPFDDYNKTLISVGVSRAWYLPGIWSKSNKNGINDYIIRARLERVPSPTDHPKGRLGWLARETFLEFKDVHNAQVQAGLHHVDWGEDALRYAARVCAEVVAADSIFRFWGQDA